MKSILFVDDDPNVLEGLRRMLYCQRHEWEMAFASNGEAALTLMDAHPFEVIITDMRMPGMDGAALLKRVRDRHPDAVRIVLSGHTELQTALRAVPVAHQFLTKPCDPQSLRVSIGRATTLSSVLTSKALANLIHSIRDLPSLPHTYAALQEALSEPDASVDKLAKIVEQDVAISAKVLQLVNSSFFGIVREIATPRTAVAYLGIEILRQLVLSAEVFRVFQVSGQVGAHWLMELSSHSQLVAKIASKMNLSKLLPEAALVSALLHDVGKLVLASRMPKEFSRALELSREQQRPLHDIEQEMLGVTHAEVGAHLLGLWGMPCIVVEGVAYHHGPWRVSRQQPDAIDAVYVANILAHRYSPEERGDAGHVVDPINTEYLNNLGVGNRLPEWEKLAESAANESEKASR